MEYKGPGEDTIAAIATPMGRGGIGIVRISGPRAKETAQKVFKPRGTVQELKSHHLYVGHFCDPSSGEIIDEVLLSYMKQPRSYTREDVVEINSHSGPYLLTRILQVILEQGIRLARPGEFTFRAFMNGRIDLTQAEAIVDLINSKSDRGLQLAAMQISGVLRSTIEELRQRALDLIAHVEAAIDFPEEDFAVLPREETVSRIEHELLSPIRRMIADHDRRKLWMDGIKLVIVGRVNAGKSSLLNRLLNEQKAIVTPHPGTTRDVIESTIQINGIPFRIVDTAGFRKAKGEVEKIGVRMAEEQMAQADLVLLVIDQSRTLNQEDIRLIQKAKKDKSIAVVNKVDLPSRLDERRLSSLLGGLPKVRVCAIRGDGIHELKERIAHTVMTGRITGDSGSMAPNVRHTQALARALEAFSRASETINEDLPYEITAMELHMGLDALGEITGETTSDEILDRIFSEFCLGK
ncbi:MAG: tRNA uridine-5-carboxymethylaminomethyl(34) synthesis GTPase MnmE [Deltaproteobacteria bacterium]|nr:tRNA uridine-5-carboxymethylaminomethyl(34) synthesis GTPase MnmE [Deltaproteobacteria bacterium]